MRRASRLHDTGRPVLASNTATPTGEVSTRGLEAGAGPALVAAGARAGHGARRQGGEQPQHLLVLAGELFPTLLLDEIGVGGMHAAMAHRRALEGPLRLALGGEAERAYMGGDVGEAQRSAKVAEVPEEPRPASASPRAGGGPPRRSPR